MERCADRLVCRTDAMSSYTHLAQVYDFLMQDSPYDRWLEWVGDFWREHGQPRTVLDLGCGTGNIAIPLAKQGHQVVGIDLSSEMLAMAFEKAQRAQVKVKWLEQDMRTLEAPQADSVISLCDSFSYLTEEEDVQQAFQQVYDHLTPGGYFLFDVHSPYKITHIFGENTFTLLEEDIAYIWNCFCDADRLEVEHQLTFFIKQPNGLFQRLEESHVQRAYQPTQMIQWLREAGFTEIKLTADFANLPPNRESERLFYAARRPLD